MKAGTLLQKARRELEKVSVNPYQESLWMLADILDLSTGEIYLGKENISEDQEKLFWNCIQKRKQAEPLEYILKEKFFFKNRFYVEKGVFIPRLETEIIIHWVLNNIQDTNLKAVDFGAGAGPLCLTLLSYFSGCQFVALEIHKKSIGCLKKNREIFQMQDRLSVLQQDVCQMDIKELQRILGGSPFLIVANPPYIDPKDKSIDKAVYLFEPPLAIFSSESGMNCIFSWFKKAMEILNPGGVYIFEFGWNQEEKVRQFCRSREELSSYEIHRDGAGNPRMAVCFKK